MTTTCDRRIVRLNIRHLRRHAERAIWERLHYSAPEALLGIERDGTSVIIRLNSGGNALAVESYLRQRGYHAEDAGGNPDGYGCAVRVTAPPKESRNAESRVIEQARKRAAELFAMAEDENWLGI